MSLLGVDEHALGFHGDTALIGDMTHGVRLDPFGALDVRFHPQGEAERGPAPITQGESAGVGGSTQLVGRCTQHVVEDQGSHPAVNMLRRALVCRRE
jgi:hypothetical protein